MYKRQVTPYRTKQFLTVDSIEVGTRFMAWYDIVLQSFPGQAGTDAVLVLPEQINDSTAGKIVCGDVALTENYRIENDVKLVPVRAVAEALGLTTSYEEVGNARNAVSYTHLDVYKRQCQKKGRFHLVEAALILHIKILNPLCAAGVAQFSDGFILNLANSLAGDAKGLTNLLQCMGSAIINAKPHIE